jgi:ferritin-like metal-binding protein YciE
MKMFSANIDNLRNLYYNQLQMLLSAEQQITEALPKMASKATDPQLKKAFETHLDETRTHVTRLEQLLNSTQGEAKSVKCKVLATMVTETEDMIKDAADDAVRDAVLITAAQRVEHFEIACYGTVRRWAQLIGENSQAEILNQTLQEEGHADHLLTQISERVNVSAERAA